MHLHVHIAILNRGLRADHGDIRWSALDFSPMMMARLGLAAFAERTLARKLTALGIRLVQQESGDSFDVGGITAETLDTFKRNRRADYQDELNRRLNDFHDLNGREPNRRERWWIGQDTTRATKKPKKRYDAEHPAPSQADRVGRWEKQARDAEVQLLDEIHRAAAEYAAGAGGPAELTPVQRERTIRIAVARVQQGGAKWSVHQLMWELHRALPMQPAHVDAAALLEQMAHDALTGMVPDVTPVLLNPQPGGLDVDFLGVRASDGQSVHNQPGMRRYATVSHLDTEEFIVSEAAKTRRQLIGEETAQAARRQATSLSADQGEVLQALLRSDRMITSLRAAAGTGKTRLAAAVAKTWAAETGGTVFGVTVSENAARVAAGEMRAAGAPAQTYNLARFLGKTRNGKIVKPVELSARDVVILDEASQVDTTDLARLVDMAGRSGARIFMVGDEHQLTSVGAGGMFPLLTERYGALELTEVHRFQQKWEKEASLRLRKGDVTVIADYQARGRIFAGDEAEVQKAIVLDWAADWRAGKDTLMIAATREQVATLNRLAREHIVKVRDAEQKASGPPQPGRNRRSPSRTGTPRQRGTGSRPG